MGRRAPAGINIQEPKPELGKGRWKILLSDLPVTCHRAFPTSTFPALDTRPSTQNSDVRIHCLFKQLCRIQRP